MPAEATLQMVGIVWISFGKQNDKSIWIIKCSHWLDLPTNPTTTLELELPRMYLDDAIAGNYIDSAYGSNGFVLIPQWGCSTRRTWCVQLILAMAATWPRQLSSEAVCPRKRHAGTAREMHLRTCSIFPEHVKGGFLFRSLGFWGCSLVRRSPLQQQWPLKWKQPFVLYW